MSGDEVIRRMFAERGEPHACVDVNRCPVKDLRLVPARLVTPDGEMRSVWGFAAEGTAAVMTFVRLQRMAEMRISDSEGKTIDADVVQGFYKDHEDQIMRGMAAEHRWQSWVCDQLARHSGTHAVVVDLHM